MGDSSGIDPAALQKMIASFGSDNTALRAWASQLKSRFAEHGLDTSALDELLAICGWMDDQEPMLQRRQGLATVLAADDGPGTGMVQIPEPVTETSAQAQTDGSELAEEFNKNNGGDEGAGEQYHRPPWS